MARCQRGRRGSSQCRPCVQRGRAQQRVRVHRGVEQKRLCRSPRRRAAGLGSTGGAGRQTRAQRGQQARTQRLLLLLRLRQRKSRSGAVAARGAQRPAHVRGRSGAQARRVLRRAHQQRVCHEAAARHGVRQRFLKALRPEPLAAHAAQRRQQPRLRSVVQLRRLQRAVHARVRARHGERSVRRPSALAARSLRAPRRNARLQQRLPRGGASLGLHGQLQRLHRKEAGKFGLLLLQLGSCARRRAPAGWLSPAAIAHFVDSKGEPHGEGIADPKVAATGADAATAAKAKKARGDAAAPAALPAAAALSDTQAVAFVIGRLARFLWRHVGEELNPPAALTLSEDLVAAVPAGATEPERLYAAGMWVQAVPDRAAVYRRRAACVLLGIFFDAGPDGQWWPVGSVCGRRVFRSRGLAWWGKILLAAAVAVAAEGKLRPQLLLSLRRGRLEADIAHRELCTGCDVHQRPHVQHAAYVIEFAAGATRVVRQLRAAEHQRGSGGLALALGCGSVESVRVGAHGAQQPRDLRGRQAVRHAGSSTRGVQVFR